MSDKWTEAERLAAEVLASGSDESLRSLLAELDRHPPRKRRSGPTSSPRRLFPTLSARRKGDSSRTSAWRHHGLTVVAVDAVVIVVAVASIAVGAGPLLTPIADAPPVISGPFEIPAIPTLSVSQPPPAIQSMTAADRPVDRNDPVSLLARELESTVGRYQAVAGMFQRRALPCSQLRESYSAVEDDWMRYSIARGRTYGDRMPDGLVRWDAALYEAVQDVDRDFTASGCSRL